MAEAKARLASIFDGSANQATQSQGNDPLRYRPPREPTRNAQAAPAQQQQQQQPPATANSVVFSATVSLYKYEGNKYVQQGTAASTLVGCVLVGAEVTYSVLFYSADKTTLCEVPLKAWKPIVQPKNYMNFYDERSVNWSVKFPSEDALAEFMRQAFLVKIHIEIWSPQRSLDANLLLKEDIGTSAIKTKKDDDSALTPVSSGDRVGVEFKCWRVVGNSKAQPSDFVTKYPPFEKASEGDLRKFRLGDGSERIKALDEGVVGMKRGGRRIILAPPGKTNGSDWYLIDVTLVQTKRKSERRAATGDAAAAQASSAGASSPGETRRSERKSSKRASTNGDIVRVDDDKSKTETEERLRQLERELERHREMASGGSAQQPGVNAPNGFAQAAPAPNQYSTMYGATGNIGGFSMPFGYSPPQPQQGVMMATGRPVDALVMELHAKVDYLIRNAATNGAGATSSYGGPVGATDVQMVLRGVERLAGENERLLLQINSQNQQYVSYEKRCEELLKQNQRLQEEKRLADEKYQSMASLQLNYSAEISSLTGARDAAITQSNKIHAEYQQLLNAYYQIQQNSNANEEQRNALEFERQARVRLEKDVQKESQTRSLVEQELTLVKRQLDVFTRMKETELQNHRQEMEKQLQAVRATQHQEVEDRIKKITTDYQQQEKRLQQEWNAQTDRQAAQFQAQIESLQSQLAERDATRQQLDTELQSAWIRVRELESNLATQAISATNEAAAVGLAEEEKRIYTVQIELLQQQVKELEAEKFERVQSDLASGRLGSPSSSPRSRKTLQFADESEAAAAVAQAEQALAAAKAKEESADRTLALAEEIKREAEAALASASGAPSDQSQGVREKTVALFKEAINEIFFRFQDVFEDESYATVSLEGKQVLGVIRKVLKQSTKEVVQRLQEEEPTPVPAPVAAPPAAVPLPTPSRNEQEEQAPAKFSLAVPLAAGVTAAALGAAVVAGSGNDSDASNDEPPPPPELEEATVSASVKEAETKPESKPETAAPEKENTAATETKKAETAEEDEEDDVVGDDLLFGAASANATATFPIASGVTRPPDDSEDSEDDFEN